MSRDSRLERWLSAAAWGICAVLFSSSSAGAQSSHNGLSWVRAEGAEACPASQVVHEAVALRLGYEPFSEPVRHSFEIVARRKGSVWQADIHLYDSEAHSGVRTIEAEGADCGPLVNAVALAVALAIDPDAMLQTEQPAKKRARVVDAGISVQSAPASIAPSASNQERSATPHMGISLRALATPNMLPEWASGVALVTDLHTEGVFGASAGAFWLPSVRAHSHSARFGFGLTAAWLDGCLLPLKDPMMLGICAGPRVGVMHTVVYEPTPTAPGDRAWVAAAATLSLEVPLSKAVFVEAGLEGTVPFVRHRYQLEGSEGTVFQQSAFLASMFIGAGYRAK